MRAAEEEALRPEDTGRTITGLLIRRQGPRRPCETFQMLKSETVILQCYTPGITSPKEPGTRVQNKRCVEQGTFSDIFETKGSDTIWKHWSSHKNFMWSKGTGRCSDRRTSHVELPMTSGVAHPSLNLPGWQDSTSPAAFKEGFGVLQ